jgi:hypothetical protein
VLLILNDPHGITGRQQHQLDLSASLQDNIARHLACGGDCELFINGIKVDPLTDPRLDAPPSVLDQVAVMRRPAGVETWLLVASLILSVYSIANAPRVGDQPVPNDSPNGRLTGQTNIARAYQAVPDVYGLRRVWPDLIQPSVVEYRDHLKYVTEWLCISRGRGDITDVQFAETPLADIDGASYQVFQPEVVGPVSPGVPQNYPENQITTLTDVLEAFEARDVNGQEISAVTFPLGLERTADLTLDGTSTFLLTMPDEGAFATLKALAPSGTARVVFHYVVDTSPLQLAYFDAVCTVAAFTVTGSDVEFEFTAPSALVGVSPQVVSATIYAAATSAATIGPFTLPLAGERIRWNTVFLRGLDGTVEINAEWWEIDSNGDEISGTREDQDFEYTAATFDERAFTNEVTPAAGLGRYRIQFTRLTADLANGADVAKLENLYAVRYYATKTLPGVTVIKCTTRATPAATGVRERRFNLRWNRHVRTLSTDPIEQADITPSRNFARAMAHLWCVAGEDLGELDTTTLAAINTAIGETSPLLRFDGSIDDANMSLGERLQLMADTARCAVWRDGNQWTVTRDEERTGTPALQLDYRNLARAGESQIAYAAHLPASHDGIELEYTDEATQASKAYVQLSISTGSVTAGASANPRKIKLPGCATEDQADNRAQLEARRLLYQRINVTDTALSDGGLLGLGTLVRWVDPNDFAGDDGLQAGEVLAIASTTITTSEPLDWKSETTGRMAFTGDDGAVLGPPVIVTPGATPRQAVLASVPSGLYVADGATRQLGSRYAFGPGLTEAEIEAAGLYVVTKATPGADRTVSIALSNYDARMYAAD